MSLALTQINVSADTFGIWLTRFNTVITELNTTVVTVSANSVGLTTGTGFVNGAFGSNTIFIPLALRGGNSSASANLNITSNINFTGNTIVLPTSATINIGASVGANSTAYRATEFVTANTTKLTANSLILNNVTYSTLMASLEVQVNNVAFVNTGSLNFIGGNYVTLETIAANGAVPASIRVNLSANTGFGVAGPDTSVQFNDGGVFGGNASFTFNEATGMVTATAITVANVTLPQAAKVTAQTNITTTVSNNYIIDQLAIADFIGAEYTIHIHYTTANTRYSSKMMMLHDGATSTITEYAAIDLANSNPTFTANVSGGNARLYFTTTANSVVRVVREGIKQT